MPTRPGESRQQLPQGGLLPTHQIQDDFGPAARRFHAARGGKVVRGEWCIQRQMREVIPTETARETLAPGIWICQSAQCLRHPLCFACTGGNQRAEAWQDQRLIGAAPRPRDLRLEIGIEGLCTRLLHLRRENGLGMACSKITACVR